MEEFANWASIIGLCISIISLILIKRTYTKISNNTNYEKSNNSQEAFGIKNKQEMKIK